MAAAQQNLASFGVSRRVVKGTVALLGFGMWALIGCGGVEGGDTPTPSTTFSGVYADYFQQCLACHTPDAPGRTSITETTLDFTSESTAESTIAGGTAAGLSGNQTDCNGVAFLGETPESSLILAAIDADTRANFAVGNCNADTISDMTVKVGFAPDATFIANLKTWIQEENGAVSRP